MKPTLGKSEATNRIGWGLATSRRDYPDYVNMVGK